MADRTEPFLARAGLALAQWTEKWFPDSLVFAFLGILATFFLGLCIGQPPARLASEGGKSFWALVPFTMQMAMVIIGGFTVASAPAVSGLIERLARVPKTPRGAVAFVAFFSMASSLLSWGFSLIFSGLLVKALARRMKDLDYRAAGAAAYLGLGAVWALGLSSSAALMMATKSAMPQKIFAISGRIPLTQTLFLWQSLLLAAILVSVSVLIAYASAPGAGQGRNAASFGVDLSPRKRDLAPATRPGEWLEHSPLLNLLVAGLLTWYQARIFLTSPHGILAALDLDTYNLLFITAGLLLHWRPKRFAAAVAQAVPAAGGVLIQFPFYAVIFGMITGAGISEWMARSFARLSTPGTYPILVAAYSAALGIFIPSGGSKWAVEATYILEAAKLHHVHLGWVVQTYNAAEALPNLVNPFWMLPLLAILGVKARDLVGYSFLQFLVHVPVVFFLCWLLARTLPFVPAAP